MKIPSFKKCYLLVISATLLLFCSLAFAQDIIIDKDDPEEKRKNRIILPYAFYSETLDFAFGVGGYTEGFLQKNMRLFGALLATSNSSYAVFFYGQDVRIPYSDRLFINPAFSVGKYTELRAYVDGNPAFPDERAGSNDSSKDNYIEGKGWANWVLVEFKYVLPIGQAKESAINTFVLDRGILESGASGGSTWNPFKSGRTFLNINPFYRIYNYDHLENDDQPFATNGLQFALKYDNTDFPTNPSKGSMQYVMLSRDFGLFDSSGSWTEIEGGISKYFSLGSTKWFRQQVIALDVWAAYSITADEVENNGTTSVEDAPPFYQGARLGGFWRMRAFPFYRFHDRGAIYYCAEYRVIPEWNPLGEMKLLKKFNIDWWQFVVFAEGGRVAEDLDFENLYSDLHWDVGLGLRALISNAIVRLDVAFSDEDWGMTVMFGQPF